jgi:hypothetical protein
VKWLCALANTGCRRSQMRVCHRLELEWARCAKPTGTVPARVTCGCRGWRLQSPWQLLQSDGGESGTRVEDVKRGSGMQSAMAAEHQRGGQWRPCCVTWAAAALKQRGKRGCFENTYPLADAQGVWRPLVRGEAQRQATGRAGAVDRSIRYQQTDCGSEWSCSGRNERAFLTMVPLVLISRPVPCWAAKAT